MKISQSYLYQTSNIYMCWLLFESFLITCQELKHFKNEFKVVFKTKN